MYYSIENNILLLNIDATIISFISLKKAISLIIKDKAKIINFYENSNILHPILNIKKPKLLILKYYVRIPYHKAKLNRQNVFLRDNFQCQYCGEKVSIKTGTIDHIVPKSNRNYPGISWENVVVSCRKCNCKKADKIPEEAGMSLLKHPISPTVECLLKNNKEAKIIIESFKSNCF